jgi:hypothetical protein
MESISCLEKAVGQLKTIIVKIIHSFWCSLEDRQKLVKTNFKTTRSKKFPLKGKSSCTPRRCGFLSMCAPTLILSTLFKLYDYLQSLSLQQVGQVCGLPRMEQRAPVGYEQR